MPILIVCTAALSYAFAAAPPTDEAAQLKDISHFALGSIGRAGIESEGEKAFREMLRKPDAVQTFREVLKNGTPAARLYALCGIRLLKPEEFAASAELVRNSDEKVTLIRGCIVAHEMLGKVAGEIGQGKYDEALKNPSR